MFDCPARMNTLIFPSAEVEAAKAKRTSATAQGLKIMGIPSLLCRFWRLGEVAEIREYHGEVDEATLFGVGVAAAADIRIAVAAPYAEDAKERAQRPGQGRAAN